MKKRVPLARSIIFDTTKDSIKPGVLLYDEPTTGLDPIASTVVKDLILSIHFVMLHGSKWLRSLLISIPDKYVCGFIQNQNIEVEQDKRKGTKVGLTFAFRFKDATISSSNQGADLIRQGWSWRGPNVHQEGYVYR